jgi:hypothetical protein
MSDGHLRCTHVMASTVNFLGSAALKGSPMLRILPTWQAERRTLWAWFRARLSAHYLYIYVSIYGSSALCWSLAAFQFLDLHTVDRIPWTGDLPIARPLPAHTGHHKHRIKVISLTRRPPFIPTKIPGTHFCYRLSRPQGHSANGMIT